MEPVLLAIGLTTLDVTARPVDDLTRTDRAVLIDGIACTPAGTAGGAALVAARLGVPTALAGAVGDDPAGAFVRLGLEGARVDTALLVSRAGRPTSTTLLTVESGGRRSSFHAPGAGMSTTIDAATTAAARGAEFVHYGGVGGEALDRGPGAALLRAAKDASAIVTCDLIAPRRSAPDELRRLLPHVDYFLPSAGEAAALTGSDDPGAAADAFLAMGAGACIIKAGAEGAFVALGGERHRLPAHLIEPVDTTSCGDAFCAGFIAALSRGWAPLEACRFAIAAAALVAGGLGTLGKLEGFDQTVKAMRAMPMRGPD